MEEDPRGLPGGWVWPAVPHVSVHHVVGVRCRYMRPLFVFHQCGGQSVWGDLRVATHAELLSKPVRPDTPPPYVDDVASPCGPQARPPWPCRLPGADASFTWVEQAGLGVEAKVRVFAGELRQ